jgi:hypothetical protein
VRAKPAASASLLALLAVAGAARGEETRFAVIDLAPAPEHEKLVGAVEKEVARLRPGARPLEDPVMRRLLGTGEGPAAAATRLLREAEARRAADDCNGAVEKATAAETMILAALTVDEERDQLKTLYGLLVICEDRRGRAKELAVAAQRLRALISLPPTDFPSDLWEKHVAHATGGTPSVELQVDSDPPNAQVSINFHGEGVTPRTLKVAPGLIYVELQKEGFKKAFRAVEARQRPVRTVMRLVEKTFDRVEQAEAQLAILKKGELAQRSLTMSKLSQMARVETLVLVNASGGRVKIWFFDAERGALTEKPIDSPYDAATGRVEALAARATPPGGQAATPALPTPSAPKPPVATAPAAPEKQMGPSKTAPPSATEPAPASLPEAEGLPEARAQQQQAQYKPRRKRPGAPWWSWLIAGAVGVAFFGFVFSERQEQADTIAVRARWVPPGN